MGSGWTLEGTQLACRTGVFRARVETDSASLLYSRVFAPSREAPFLSFVASDLRFRRGGQLFSLKPAPGQGYIQDPYAVVPFAIDSDAGLELTAFVRSEAGQLHADFRLNTQLEVDTCELDVRLTFENCTTTFWKTQGAGLRRIDSPPSIMQSRAIIKAECGPDVSFAVFLDPGEDGGIEVGQANPGADGAQDVGCLMFQQSLEKGVIVVGRISVLAWMSPDNVLNQFDQWLNQPASL